MGKLEKESRKRSRKANLQKTILSAIFIAGGLSIALMATKMTKIFNKIEPDFMKSKYRKYSFNRSLERLKKNDLIFWEKINGKNLVRLTSKGEAKLRQLEINDFKIKKPRRWDQKWRLLAFDIKEERRGLRNKIRHTLRQIGFIRLQDSVWVYPYDCEDLVMLLKADFKIGKDLIYIIADSIENDKFLRKEFDL
ncbi:MAG: CRISPR-associated endonuclease Cas2 [Candidatus Nomurabacteria bacterium]|nr:CRISPR-associated endonuclease Cas2 [Candidatus Nomurabacteria bacterium]